MNVDFVENLRIIERSLSFWAVLCFCVGAWFNDDLFVDSELDRMQLYW